MQSSSELKKDSFFQGPVARALPGTDRNPTRGPPAARLSTGYSGRRPGHGVAGTTPVSHSGRALKACPRAPGADSGSHSAKQSAPQPGTVPGTGTREEPCERHWRRVPGGVPHDDLLLAEGDGIVHSPGSTTHLKRSRLVPRAPTGRHGSHSAKLVFHLGRGPGSQLSEAFPHGRHKQCAP